MHAPLPPGLTEDLLRASGVTAYGIIAPSSIEFSDEVRRLCEENRCGNYARTWACPPAVGTLDDCRTRILSHAHALVFSTAYPLEDSFDWEGMTRGHRAFKQVCDDLHRHLRAPALLLSNEGCLRCAACAYPEPCRFPDRLFPSLEGYGILVNKLAESAGVPYLNGPLTVTYFGLLCTN